MAKVRAVQDLAERVLSGELELNRVARMPDDEVVSALTQVRGIGPWTAEMFLMFQLGRLNVWPTTDLGVRKGYALIHGLALPPESKELELLGDDYRPFRSVAAWYCWRVLDDK
jgi:DNA-3-methyladenine glycosylase II